MIVNGRVDWATWRAGPPNKTYGREQKFGIVCHSMEGSLAGSLAELDKATRPASWPFSFALDGQVLQHYHFLESCWASGSYQANVRFIALEAEGKAGLPLNDAQIQSALRFFGEIEPLIDGGLVRGVSLFNHNEVATKWEPNAGPTACPSGRWDPVFEAWAVIKSGGEDYVFSKKLDELNAALVKREELRKLASETSEEGFDRMLRSHALLKEKGLI